MVYAGETMELKETNTNVEDQYHGNRNVAALALTQIKPD